MKTSRVASMVAEMLHENCRTANSSQRKRIICRRLKSAFNHLVTNTNSSFSLCSFSTFICFQCDAFFFFFFELGKEAKSRAVSWGHAMMVKSHPWFGADESWAGSCACSSGCSLMCSDERQPISRILISKQLQCCWKSSSSPLTP